MTYFNTPITKEILDKLEAKYEKKYDSHVNNLWKKFTRAQCEEGTDVRKHANDMVAIANELIFHGRVVDEKIIVSTIINSSPSSYNWWADSRVTVHVSNDLQGFKEIRRIESGQSFTYMRNDDKGSIDKVARE
ncbi:uncharacterized protein A4U43_C08F32950 [Asparagus officinalis]|nr:uncharacterized protein A4U43_C08F32950 [Asparagus officinalis]